MRELIETEIKLLVTAARPATILAQLDELTELGEYTILGVATVHVRDVYYDTRDLRLLKNGCALRVRRENGAAQMTLKVEWRGSWRFNVRSEYSENLSPPALEAALRSPECSSLLRKAQDAGLIEPMKELHRQLQKVVVLDNRRRKSNIFKEDAAIAQLSVDEVIYELPVEGRFVEIEVEAISERYTKDLEAIASELHRVFPGKLAVSLTSKYERGISLAKAMAGEAARAAYRPRTQVSEGDS